MCLTIGELGDSNPGLLGRERKRYYSVIYPRAHSSHSLFGVPSRHVEPYAFRLYASSVTHYKLITSLFLLGVPSRHVEPYAFRLCASSVTHYKLITSLFSVDSVD